MEYLVLYKEMDKQFVIENKVSLFQYQFENEFGKSRVHLRIDEQEEIGTLIINANRILHLNSTASMLAQLILDKKTDIFIINYFKKKYNVTERQAKQDLLDMRSQLAELLNPNGSCPIHSMDIEILSPFSSKPSAPYRMDLALTYRCNNNCTHCYNARERHFPELSTDKWKMILDETWKLGIPHIVFTGGEPTLRDDLAELISHAESNGQITGLNTNGRKLSNPEFVDKLVAAGLDHIQITFESSNPAIHNEMVNASAYDQTLQGIKNAVNSQLFVMTNTTMLATNFESIPATLDLLAELNVPTIGLNALIHSGKGKTVGTGLSEDSLSGILKLAQLKTDHAGQRLVWYTPTKYCGFDPQYLDLGVKGCSAALYNMCIEPNGDVIPCQSYYQPVGNILTDSWDSIWNHDLSVSLRERKGLPEKCISCNLVNECGGGCPLQFESDSINIGV